MTRLGFVMLAYGATWLAIFGYTLVLGQRQKKLEREIRMLKDALPKSKA